MAIVTRGLGGATLVTEGYGVDGVTPVPPPPPFYPTHPSRELLQPGIRFANVPRGKPMFVARNGTRVEHVNTVENIVQALSDRPTLSGVIRYRFRPVPSSVSSKETRNLDQFGNVVYPGTGR